MKINQKGFSIIEILLVFIAITLLVGVGAYVYNMQSDTQDEQKNTNTSQSTSESSSTDSSSAKKTEYIEFPELDVKIKKSSELDDVTFKKIEDSKGAYTLVSSGEFEKAVQQCRKTGAENTEPLSTMAVEKITGTPESSGIVIGQLLKQFDGFHLNASYPNGALCDDPSKSAEIRSGVMTTVNNAVIKAFSTAEQL